MGISFYFLQTLQFFGFFLFVYLVWLAVKPLAKAYWNEELEDKTNKQMAEMIRWKIAIIAGMVFVFTAFNPFMSFNQIDAVEKQRTHRENIELHRRDDPYGERVPILGEPSRDEQRVRANRQQRSLDFHKQLEQSRQRLELESPIIDDKKETDQ